MAVIWIGFNSQAFRNHGEFIVTASKWVLKSPIVEPVKGQPIISSLHTPKYRCAGIKEGSPKHEPGGSEGFFLDYHSFYAPL